MSMENYLEINYEKNMAMLSEAMEYCYQNLTHEDLINELFKDNDLKKQLCIIEIKKLNSQSEADILIDNLTGKSGPIRETVSFKVLELIKQDEFCKYFQKKEILDVLVKAVTDINPSVSRNTVEIIRYVDNAQYLYDSFIQEIKKTLNEMDDIQQTRSYNSNKKNFNLYWNIEAIINIGFKIQVDEDFLEILKQTVYSNDYTIREKTAKAASILFTQDYRFKDVLNLLSNDSNIYVQKYL